MTPMPNATVATTQRSLPAAKSDSTRALSWGALPAWYARHGTPDTYRCLARSSACCLRDA